MQALLSYRLLVTGFCDGCPEEMDVLKKMCYTTYDKKMPREDSSLMGHSSSSCYNWLVIIVTEARER